MKVHACVAISAIYLFAPTTPARAQQGTRIEFVVPLNLSQLSPDIATVGVFCWVRSSTIPGGMSYSIARQTPAGGRVQATVPVRVSIAQLDDPAGKSATYICELQGLRTGQNQWVKFSENASDSAFRLSPNPAPITGSFDWVQPAPLADVAPVSVTTTSPGGNP